MPTNHKYVKDSGKVIGASRNSEVGCHFKAEGSKAAYCFNFKKTD